MKSLRRAHLGSATFEKSSHTNSQMPNDAEAGEVGKTGASPTLASPPFSCATVAYRRVAMTGFVGYIVPKTVH